MLSVIYYINGDPNSEGSTIHVVKFFGIFGCIKVNALRQEFPTNLDKFNVVEYYFDYPYFSKIVNPEHFQEKLDDGEKRFTRIITSMWSCAAILSIASNVLLCLAYSNQKSKKVLAVLATASAVLSTIACIFFVVGILWVFFDFVKEKLVIHKIKSLLKDELSDEWITLFKNKFLGEKSEINGKANDEEANDKELEKNKNIEEILQFFLERRKIPALFKFLTNGEELV
ncbi:hypothetical protein [Wolbachia endosymbiont (group E) of Neria commutata]|uniref:hypothetical protein n=1 Tax=Wolbachia endosymbiont (group E) of Neria commutata TaxID=3066149 RepID=UPI003132EA8B